MADRKVVRNNDGLSLQESRFADLVASGLSQSEAYAQAFNPADPGNRQSISVSASRVVKRDRVARRIEELKAFHHAPLVASERDGRLLDNEWLRLETLFVLHTLATQGESERTRLDAASKLAIATGLIAAPHANGTTVNVNQQQANLLPGGSSPDQIRSQLVSSLKGLLPQPIVVEADLAE